LALRTNSRITGNLAAGAFTVTVSSGAPIADTNPILFTATVGSLAGGETTVNGVIAGQSANLYAVADPERLLPELDESNNVAVALFLPMV
jgi:hypothetical protein